MRKNRAEKWAKNPQKAKNRAKMNQKRAKGGRFYYRFFSTCRITACGKSSRNFESGSVQLDVRLGCRKEFPKWVV